MVIISFDEMANRSGVDYETIKELSNGSDAFVHEKNKIVFILYDNKVSSIGRIRWSIAHEYGHIVLKHKNQCGQNEVEANFFAANLLVPQCILKELLNRRGDITIDYLKNKFSISGEAAEKYLLGVNARGFEYFKNEYDDIIVTKARKFLNDEIRNSRLFQMSIDEEMQEKRNNWMYE